MSRTHEFYRKLFQTYPDVVNTKQFRDMLGGIGEVTALHLLQSGKVPSFKIRGAYCIPKTGIIEYIMSKDYKRYRTILKHQIKYPVSGRR